MTENNLQSNLAFRLMALKFRLRDWMHPPAEILQAAGLKPGMSVLDFGCGPGGFSLAAARLVGPGAQVYAVDIHPLALEMVRAAADRQGLRNIQTVGGEKLADIPEASIDLVLLYDVLHELPEPGRVLIKLHQLLKPEGVLSLSDHHLKKEKLLTLAAECHFTLLPAGNQTLQFSKKTPSREIS